MARKRINRNSLNNLAAVSLASLPQGVHSDGSGLYLRVLATGARRWIFAWKANGKRTELGLGTFPNMTLASARSKAETYRNMVAAGEDAAAAHRLARKGGGAEKPKTFRDVMDAHLADKVAALRNPKHRAQWRSTLETYAAPLLAMPVASIGTADVLGVLKPIWQAKPETASRVRGRIETILNAAKAHGLRTGENPAAWRGHLANLLPARNMRLTVKHFSAVDWREAPAHFQGLSDARSTSALCLAWIALTACRSGEGRAARWSEIDEKEGVWTIPAARTKTAREHRVPLSKDALAILEKVRPLKSGSEADALIFPGGREGRPLSDVAVTKALRRISPSATVHGWRSTFRDWVSEATHFPRELAEEALAHVVGSTVERAYRRGDALEKRRALMDAWAGFLTAEDSGNVIALSTAAKGRP